MSFSSQDSILPAFGNDAHASVQAAVAIALQEDIGTGDITSNLLPETSWGHGYIISREAAVFCGKSWVEAVFYTIDPSLRLNWQVNDGDRILPRQRVLAIEGNQRAILTAERTALNFMQMLSGTATVTRQYVDQLVGTKTRLLDTRKTLPGLRAAQKYAVHCGGGMNHRMGLYDAFLIKENHILACGSLTAAVKRARDQDPSKLLEVEVESFIQLEELLTLLDSGVIIDRIMLDNFSVDTLSQAVARVQKKIPLEVSGNVDLSTLRVIAETGVDFISVGAITKHLRAVDYSLLLE